MRILLIHQYFLEKDEGGGTRFNEMTKIWAAEGHQITVLAGMIHANGLKKSDRYKGKYFHLESLEENIEVLRCHISESYNVNFTGRIWAYFSFVFSGLAGFFLKLNKTYDVVLVTSPPLFVGITALLISKIKGIPMVFEVRDLWPESAIELGVLKNKTLIKMSLWLEAYLYESAKLINVLTPAFQSFLELKKEVPSSKIIYISNGTDFSISEPVLEKIDPISFREAMGWQDKFVVVYAGAHGFANNLDLVLETADLMRFSNVLFFLIGEGMEKQALKQKALEMKLENVVFSNMIPKGKVFEYIASANAGLTIMKNIPVFETIYCNKTFDYMGGKIPIVMGLNGISKKLVIDSKSGVLVNPGDKSDLADKILWLANHPKEAKKMGQNGYEYAKQNLDRKVLGMEYLTELLKVSKTFNPPN